MTSTSFRSEPRPAWAWGVDLFLEACARRYAAELGDASMGADDAPGSGLGRHAGEPPGGQTVHRGGPAKRAHDECETHPAPEDARPSTTHDEGTPDRPPVTRGRTSRQPDPISDAGGRR